MRYGSLIPAAALLLAAQASAEIYVVRPDGTGDFPTIQAALVAATDGDTVELTDGTFRGEGNRDVDFMGKAVGVRSQHENPETCIIDCEGSLEDPHRAFLFLSGEEPPAMLRYIKILNGVASGPDVHDEAGGAILCTGGSAPLIFDCIFADNYATYGGAIFCDEGSHGAIDGCTFLGNEASHRGGALCCDGGTELAFVSECTFIENMATDGGAVCCQESDPPFSSNIFQGNSAGRGGGMYLEIASPLIVLCLFTDNEAGDSGGGLYGRISSPEIRECEFRGNVADFGGGVSCWTWNEPIHMSQCTLTGNRAEAWGGAAHVCAPYQDFVLEACTLYGNGASEGSGIAFQGLSGGRVILDNCLIAFGLDGEAIYCEELGSEANLACCDLFGNAGGDWVGCVADQYGVDGNIAQDPLFCDAENGDFTLREDSPCAPFTPPNEECDLIGAWPVGCGPTSAHTVTWGGIKSLYRE